MGLFKEKAVSEVDAECDRATAEGTRCADEQSSAVLDKELSAKHIVAQTDSACVCVCVCVCVRVCVCGVRNGDTTYEQKMRSLVGLFLGLFLRSLLTQPSTPVAQETKSLSFEFQRSRPCWT